MVKKPVKIILIAVGVIFVMNSIATKVIYDMAFKRYDPSEPIEYLTDERFTDLVENRRELDITSGKDTIKAYAYDVAEDKGIVVIAPGVNAGADDFIPVIGTFTDEGYDVLAFDPTGSTGSTGKSMKGYSQEIKDLEAVLATVDTDYPGEDVYLFGHSRGAFTVCTQLESDEDIKAAVAISAHNSAMDAIMALSTRYVGKFANLNYPALWCYQAILFGPKTVNIHATDLLDNSDVPVMIVQGSDDNSAPAGEYSLYSHRSEIKDDSDVIYFYSDLEDSNGHTDIIFDEDEDGVNSELMDSVLDFFEEASGS